MLDSIPVILLISTLFGFLAGIGVGGGSLLMLWLTLLVGMEQPQARILNLLFFIPSALVACLFRWRQGSLNLKKIYPAIISGCITAVLGSYLSQQLEVTCIQKIFGFLLILTGIRELVYKPQKKEHP